MNGFNNVTYECTALNGMNKVGLLRRDEQGYAQVVLGGLDVSNSAGEFYTFDQSKKLFEDSGALQRRIRSGALRGENGHPKMMPGQSPESFANRVMSIWEDRVCVHIKKVTLDFENVRDANGRKVIAIMGWVKPSGELGYVLEEALNNPNQNVAFSIRAFTDNERFRGRTNRHLRNIVTWDFVGEPGIAIATKYSSPALESLDEMNFNRHQLERAANLPGPTGVATESVKLTANELFRSFGWNLDSGKRSAWTQW